MIAASRLEALVVARAQMVRGRASLAELVAPLARFAPAELTVEAWRDRLGEVAGELRAQGVLDDAHRVRDTGELARRIGRTTARSWRKLAELVLPALGLAVAPDDGKAHARLAGRDAWAAAIVARTLGVWRDGPPPSLAALCDALAWRELGLPGAPKRCPSEIRALFVQRRLASEPGPPERLVRVLAAREIAAPRPELSALLAALVRCWLSDRALGPAEPAPPADPAEPAELARRSGAAPPASPPPAAPPRAFAEDVLAAARATRDGWFGDRKVFAAPVWRELRRDSRWAELALDDFKARLVAAHRAGALVLARADLVAAMDPELVAASEIAVDGATFHFLVVDPDPARDDQPGGTAQGAESPHGEGPPRGEAGT
jgi:hypothetical protein